jgi:hypothetical protein
LHDFFGETLRFAHRGREPHAASKLR